MLTLLDKLFLVVDPGSSFSFSIFVFYLFAKVLTEFIYTSSKIMSVFITSVLNSVSVTLLDSIISGSLFSSLIWFLLLFLSILTTCVCFYELSKAPKSPSLIGMDL